jgi:hypothetical protein
MHGPTHIFCANLTPFSLWLRVQLFRTLEKNGVDTGVDPNSVRMLRLVRFVRPGLLTQAT